MPLELYSDHALQLKPFHGAIVSARLEEVAEKLLFD